MDAWGPMVVAGLLTGCQALPVLPPLPEVPGATYVVWAAQGADGKSLRVGRLPSQPLGTALQLPEAADLELWYYGCDGSALGFEGEADPTCLPATGPRFRYRPGDSNWTPLAPEDPSAVEVCEAPLCGEVRPRVRQTVSLPPVLDDEEISATAFLPTPEGLALLVSVSGNRNQSRLLKIGPQGQVVELARDTTSRPIQDIGLWAGDGRIWSLSTIGLRRGVLQGERVEWSEVPTADTATIGLGSHGVAMAQYRSDPIELLVLARNGFTALWSEDQVRVLVPARPKIEGAIASDVADLTPLVRNQQRVGWVLLGAAEPTLDNDNRYRARSYLELIDGQLGPPITLDWLSSATTGPLGTLLMTGLGRIYRVGSSQPELLFSTDLGSDQLRAFQDQLVVSSNRGALEVLRPGAGTCPLDERPARTDTLISVEGDTLAWAGLIGQGIGLEVRFYGLPPRCPLP